jgi:flagellar biosynthesis protein FliP
MGNRFARNMLLVIAAMAVGLALGAAAKFGFQYNLSQASQVAQPKPAAHWPSKTMWHLGLFLLLVVLALAPIIIIIIKVTR